MRERQTMAKRTSRWLRTTLATLMDMPPALRMPTAAEGGPAARAEEAARCGVTVEQFDSVRSYLECESRVWLLRAVAPRIERVLRSDDSEDRDESRFVWPEGRP
jgi:hypothetical protein